MIGWSAAEGISSSTWLWLPLEPDGVGATSEDGEGPTLGVRDDKLEATCGEGVALDPIAWAGDGVHPTPSTGKGVDGKVEDGECVVGWEDNEEGLFVHDINFRT